MPALQENNIQFNFGEESLTQNELLSINAALPSSATVILQVLYNNPNQQHKALATDADISISNLSNCISKIDSIQPALLKIVKNGRSKYYSLTETGKQYVEQMILQSQPAKIRSFFSLEGSKYDEAIQLLRRFREAAGTNWDVTLIEIMSNPNSTENDAIHTLFTDFIDNLIWFKINHKDESLQKVYTVLEQNVLIKMLERHIEQCLKDYYALEPLFQLEKTCMEDAYFIIDDMFNTFNISANESESSVKMQLTDIQYNAIFYHLRIMMKDFRQYDYNKKAVIEHWKTIYHIINPILLYIAEKCHSILQPC